MKSKSEEKLNGVQFRESKQQADNCNDAGELKSERYMCDTLCVWGVFVYICVWVCVCVCGFYLSDCLNDHTNSGVTDAVFLGVRTCC